MDELIEKTMEESAPVSEKKMSARDMEAQRVYYVKERKKEVEVLELDVRFMELQVRHYELTRKIATINEEAKKEKESREFAENIKI